MSIVPLIEQAGSYVNSMFSSFLGSLLVALVIVLVGFVIGRLLGRLLERVLHEIELDNTLRRAGFKMPLEHTLATIVSYLIYFVAVIMALNHIGLTTTALYIVVGGAVILILIATVLGIKDFIPNLISGFYIYKKEPFTEGQWISCGSVEGKVKRISIIETQLETQKGDTVYVPNSLLMKETLVVKN